MLSQPALLSQARLLEEALLAHCEPDHGDISRFIDQIDELTSGH